MICPQCGAVYTEVCWNCAPPLQVQEADIPEITKTADELPPEVREHLKKRWQE